MNQARRAFGLAAVIMVGMGAAACNTNEQQVEAGASPTAPSAVAVPTTTPTAPAPTDTPTGPLGPPNSVFIQVGDTWRYLDDGSDQGTAWRQPGFDDSAWSTGGSELGYGDNDEVTTVNFGPNQNNKYITTYFRKTFTTNDASSHDLVTLDMIVDDGAIVYLNGTTVFRFNMPNGATNAATRASGAIQNSNIVVSKDIAPSLLVTGTNVIAVEVHQVTPSSPDMSFNLALRDGERSSQPNF